MLEKFFTVAPRSKTIDQSGSTLGMLLFSGRARSLIRQLAVPVKPVAASTPPGDGLDHAQFYPHHQPTSSLLNLPVEIQCNIF
jgi:hypothetical protein